MRLTRRWLSPVLLAAACSGGNDAPPLDLPPADVGGSTPLADGASGLVATGAEIIGPLGTDTEYIYYLAVDAASGTYAFHRVPANGGTIRRLLTNGPSEITGFVVRGTDFVWSTRDTIEKLPLAGGTRGTVATGVSFVEQLQNDSGLLYFGGMVNQAPGTYRIGTDGVPKLLVPNTVPFVVVGQDLFQAGGASTVLLQRQPIEGGTPETIGRDETRGALDLQKVGDFFYYRSNQGNTKGGIGRIALAGGAATVVLPVDGGAPESIAVDATHAYFVTTGTAAGTTELRRVPVTGGTVETLASGIIGAQHLLLTDDFVYFLRIDNGVRQLERLKK